MSTIEFASEFTTDHPVEDGIYLWRDNPESTEIESYPVSSGKAAVMKGNLPGPTRVDVSLMGGLWLGPIGPWGDEYEAPLTPEEYEDTDWITIGNQTIRILDITGIERKCKLAGARRDTGTKENLTHNLVIHLCGTTLETKARSEEKNNALALKILRFDQVSKITE